MKKLLLLASAFTLGTSIVAGSAFADDSETSFVLDFGGALTRPLSTTLDFKQSNNIYGGYSVTTSPAFSAMAQVALRYNISDNFAIGVGAIGFNKGAISDSVKLSDELASNFLFTNIKSDGATLGSVKESCMVKIDADDYSYAGGLSASISQKFSDSFGAGVVGFLGIGSASTMKATYTQDIVTDVAKTGGTATKTTYTDVSIFESSSSVDIFGNVALYSEIAVSSNLGIRIYGAVSVCPTLDSLKSLDVSAGGDAKDALLRRFAKDDEFDAATGASKLSNADALKRKEEYMALFKKSTKDSTDTNKNTSTFKGIANTSAAFGLSVCVAF